MESEYVMIEIFRDAQPDDGAEDMATVSSPDMDRLNQEADVASSATRKTKLRQASQCTGPWSAAPTRAHMPPT